MKCSRPHLLILKSSACFIFFALTILNVSAEQLCQPETIKSTMLSTRFFVHGSVIKDTQLGLMWQKCFVGASGEDCAVGKPTALTWAKAFQYVDEQNQNQGFAGFHDWRLPNIRELQTIAELQCVEPALNAKYFPLAPSGRTWSSSPYEFYPHYSWFVDFKYFEVTYQERYNPYFVLLVRSFEL